MIGTVDNSRQLATQGPNQSKRAKTERNKTSQWENKNIRSNILHHQNKKENSPMEDNTEADPKARPNRCQHQNARNRRPRKQIQSMAKPIENAKLNQKKGI